jgi:uncharacterized protein YqfA (UPF0365 family)
MKVIIGLAVLVIALVLIVVVFAIAAFLWQKLPLWLKAQSSGVRVTFVQMIGMHLRKLNAEFILGESIRLLKAGIEVPLPELEAHVMSGGNLSPVVQATVSAEKAGLGFTFQRLAAIDLAGRDVADGVESAVNPKVIPCPGPGQYVLGMARDGVRLKINVQVTVRMHLERIVGGAGEQTIIARVGEGIVSTVGGSETHKVILENPDMIAREILRRGLDAGTAYEIVSVDVADVGVVDNIGARLSQEQAQTDELVAQARAEGRRAMAAAKEREMKAKVMEMTSRLTLAKSELPVGVTHAYKTGKVWICADPVQADFGDNLWDAHRN